MKPEEAPGRETLHDAVRRLMLYFETLVPIPDERRQQSRMPFVHPILIITPDGKSRRCLSRDLSLDGLRLLGNEQLVGETVRVVILPTTADTAPWSFKLQVLWSTEVGDGLVDSGGRLLGVTEAKG
jgi:hypothetical protein